MDTQAHIYLCIYTYLRLYRGNKGRKTSTTKLKKTSCYSYKTIGKLLYFVMLLLFFS